MQTAHGLSIQSISRSLETAYWYSVDFGNSRRDQLRNLALFLDDTSRALLEDALQSNQSVKVKHKVCLS